MKPRVRFGALPHILALFVTAFLALPASAETNAYAVQVRGAVEHPLALALADLQAMPRAKFVAHEKDGAEVVYEGVALYEIVNRAQPKLSEHCCSNAVNTMAIIKAADNYQAVFALPELDPKFASREILLADRRDGQPLDAAHGPLQIVVPDEKVRARWVRQVNLIEILPIGDLQAGITNSATNHPTGKP